jgi:hypothetical protein
MKQRPNIGAVIQRAFARWKHRTTKRPANQVRPVIRPLPVHPTEGMKRLIDPQLAARVRKNEWPEVHCHPVLALFINRFHAELLERNLPFVIFQVWRSPQQQAKAKANGVSLAAAWESPHQFGCAVDIIHKTRGWNLTKAEWAVIGAIGKEVARKLGVRITWGGDFMSLYDPAHWELTDFREVRTSWHTLSGAGLSWQERILRAQKALPTTKDLRQRVVKRIAWQRLYMLEIDKGNKRQWH